MEQAAEPMNLLEWFSEKYKDFGAELEFVTNRFVFRTTCSLYSTRAVLYHMLTAAWISLINRSQEGSQFVKGFGGIGGLCRYKVDFAQIADTLDDVSLSLSISSFLIHLLTHLTHDTG